MVNILPSSLQANGLGLCALDRPSIEIGDGGSEKYWPAINLIDELP